MNHLHQLMINQYFLKINLFKFIPNAYYIIDIFSQIIIILLHINYYYQHYYRISTYYRIFLINIFSFKHNFYFVASNSSIQMLNFLSFFTQV